MRFIFRTILALLTVAVWNAVTLKTSAQWVDQTIALRSGWNVVFLEVQPEPRASTNVFAGLPSERAVRSVAWAASVPSKHHAQFPKQGKPLTRDFEESFKTEFSSKEEWSLAAERGGVHDAQAGDALKLGNVERSHVMPQGEPGGGNLQVLRPNHQAARLQTGPKRAWQRA